MLANFLGETPSLYGIKVYANENIPIVETEYDYLWPIVGGHIWVTGIIFETFMIAVGNNGYAVSPVTFEQILKEADNG